jgi:pimeloyl-ACP methyl ester carboxylesterase
MKNLIILLFLTIISCKNNDVNYESIVKNDAFRKEILSKKGGAFIELSKGFTYFHEENSSSNLGTIMLIHGFSVPSYIWEPTLKRLSSLGYRVVAMDLYGRGFSSNPDLPQTDNLRANQVLELMSKLNIDSAIVCGLSNGGRIISKMAHINSKKIQGLIYVSSSSFETHIEFENKKVSQQEINEYIATYPEKAKGQLEDFYKPEKFPDWPKLYEELLTHKGFAKALISTNKNLVTLDNIHKEINDLNIPVYTIWGLHDKVVVYDSFKDKLKLLLPNRKEFFIEDSAHLPQMENSNQFEIRLIQAIEEILKPSAYLLPPTH